MAQAGKQVLAKTVATRDFLGAIAQNAAAFLSLDVKALSVGENVDAILKSVHIVSVEDLDWELWFFRTSGAAGNSTDPDVNSAYGVAVLPSTAVRIGAAGLYHFYLEDLDIPLLDSERTSKIHMALINRAAAGKTAGAAGAVRVALSIEPALGF